MSTKRNEEMIQEKLTGETQKNALDFIAFLKANDIQQEEPHGVWCYKNKPVCVVYVTGDEQMPGPWTIWHSGYNPDYPTTEIPDSEDGDKIGLCDLTVDESLKEVAWAHINICGKCGCKRKPGRRTNVFGKEFENVCTSTLAFCNPNAEILENVKKLTELMKLGILKNN
jgi:hypothetical protein